MAASLDNIMRIIASRTLAVNSAAGAVASTTSLSSQTYAVDLVFPAAAASTAVRFNITDIGAAAISSLSAPLLPGNTVMRYKCAPGQMVQAIGNDASAIPSLTIIELSK